MSQTEDWMQFQTRSVPGTVIFRSEVGSGLHGTNLEGSDDHDEIAVVVEDPQHVTGLGRWDCTQRRTAPEGGRSGPDDIDLVYYGLRKYMRLAAQGNPSILQTLYVPQDKVYQQTSFGLELQGMAPQIVSKACIPRYRGYMRSQALRLTGKVGRGRGARTGARPELVEKYGWDTKFGYHMIRLGLQGIELAETGKLSVPMREGDKYICLCIRQGAMSADDTLEYAFRLDGQLSDYENDCALPDEPAWYDIQEWMHHVYLDVWGLDTWGP